MATKAQKHKEKYNIGKFRAFVTLWQKKSIKLQKSP
jgi:hypothetical protein